MLKIVVDAYGGDNCPGEAVLGAAAALKQFDDIGIVLSGNEDELRACLASVEYDKSRLEILDAKEVIDCHESPTMAIKKKKDSSLVKAMQLVTEGGADCLVSAGSTGAILAGATFIVKRIKGIKRPALSPMLPTVKGGWVMLIDCGANNDCKPQYLQQFAVMADAYMKNVMGMKEPRVALLSNGAEAEKGDELTKAAHKLLAATEGINFVGNVEAREALSGDCDVIVCDGFAGNVLLKSVEGVAAAIFDLLKAELYSSFRTKIGAALAMPAFKKLKKRMDYKEVGGAVLLGINKGVIKAHGSSDARAFASAIKQARSFAMANVNDSIAQAISALPDSED